MPKLSVQKFHCQACADLMAECGPRLFPMYSKKLLIRGWAGQYSRVERAYTRAHRKPPSEAQVAAREKGRAVLLERHRSHKTSMSEGLK